MLRRVVGCFTVAFLSLVLLADSGCATRKKGRLGDSCGSDQDCASGVCYEQQCWPGAKEVAVAVAITAGGEAPTVAAGATGKVALDVTRSGPLLRPVTMVLDGPAGVSGTFDPPELDASGSVALTLTVGVGVAANTYDLVARGESGPYKASATIKLTVPSKGLGATGDPCQKPEDCASGVCYQEKCWPQGSVSVSTSPAAIDVVAGLSGTVTATVTVVGDLPDPAVLSLLDAPDGVTGAFDPASLTATGTSKLTVAAGATVAPGPYKLRVGVASGPYSRDSELDVTVKAPLGKDGDPCVVPGDCESGVCFDKKCWPVGIVLKIDFPSDPLNLMLAQGLTAETTFALTVTGTPLAPVTFSVDSGGTPTWAPGPTGVSATFTPDSMTSSGTVKLGMAATADAIRDTYQMRVVATCGPYTGFTTFALALIRAPGDDGATCDVPEECKSAICFDHLCWPADIGMAITYVVPTDPLTVDPGGPASAQFQLTLQGTPVTPAVFSLESADGLTGTFDPPQLSEAGTTTLTVTTPAGVHGKTLSGKAVATAGPYSANASFDILVRGVSGDACDDTHGCATALTCFNSVCWGKTGLTLAVHGASGHPRIAPGGHEEVWLDISFAQGIPAPVHLDFLQPVRGITGTFDHPDLPAPPTGPVRLLIEVASDVGPTVEAWKVDATAGPDLAETDLTVEVVPVVQPTQPIPVTATVYSAALVAGEVVACGSTPDSAWGANADGDAFLARFDGTGAFQAVRTYGTAMQDEFVALAEDPAEAAAVFAAARVYDPTGGANLLDIARMDRFGDIAWVQRVTGPVNTDGNPEPLNPASGGLLPASGVLLATGNVGWEGGDPYVIGLDGTGAVLGAFRIGGVGSYQPPAVAPDGTGGVAIGGQASSCGELAGFWLARFPAVGFPTWVACIETGTGTAGGIAFEASHWVMTQTDTPMSPLNSGYDIVNKIAMVDDTGAPTIGVQFGPKVSMVSTWPMAPFAAAGHGGTAVLAQNTVDGKTDGLVLVLVASDGSLTWARSITTATRPTPLALLATADGFAVLGDSLDAKQNTVTALVLFDANGGVVLSPDGVAVADAAGILNWTSTAFNAGASAASTAIMTVTQADVTSDWTRRQ